MKPVLSAWPPKKRALAFAPFMLGAFVLAFVVLALATQSFFVTLVLAPVVGVAAAYALVGWPEIRLKDGRPLLEPKYRPWLFFALAPLFALVSYPLYGVALTEAGLPPKLLAWISMALSLVTAVVVAYFLVGFPRGIWASARKSYEAIPVDRRPFLFFPLFVVFFLIAYLSLGVASTPLMAGFLDYQVILVLPLSIAVAALPAYLLVGFPKPQRPPTEYLPKVTGKRRPHLFGGTFLLAGIPFTVILGALLTEFAQTIRILPAGLILPLAVLLGYAIALAFAALLWGTPRRWRRFDDYEPGLPPRARIPLILVGSAASGLAVMVAFGLADIDMFWGLLAGLLVAAALAMLLTGTHRVIAERRRESTLVPDLPDGVKPLILIPSWFLLAFLLFAVLTYVLPKLVSWNAIIGVVVGLLVTLALLEQPLWRELAQERRERRARKKAWAARRKAALGEDTDEQPKVG